MFYIVSGRASSHPSTLSTLRLGFTCEGCNELSQDPLVLSIVERSWDRELHSTHCTSEYLTMAQLGERAAFQRAKVVRCSLALLGRDRQLKFLTKQRDLHKKLTRTRSLL
jgi:hypothetical protein